tara:strand:+ start:462 stop:620 length:159 start_codon:yes stop_codon:yes gene_type:complete
MRRSGEASAGPEKRIAKNSDVFDEKSMVQLNAIRKSMWVGAGGGGIAGVITG